MAKNDVLLLKPIEGIGDEGEQIKVNAGFARNYLFPQKLAVPMTQANRKQLESLQRPATHAKPMNWQRLRRWRRNLTTFTWRFP